ncbi:Thiamine biosynthesis lipoprotein ApbE precursor [Pseudobythopirellula maris]|uniref:FAD:protein FMN transferase n=1 Tax=Pseudobythopirellula maris TaxID=2527991 RepID=A0A5C5ZRR1_9BACT|nr:FAD:protein FMN transferase [Pseudobythopirellula maris]TWT90232.1 Thiamine biosynthesis lipoprotein ApbE precursor [Pseudobythopirellula maris]
MISACVWLLFLATVAGCGEHGPEIVGFSGPTMGTQYHIRVIAGETTPDAPELQARVDQRLVEINRRMSTYDPESELSRFNTSESDDWFEVSAETAEVVSYSLGLARDSGGAFDPTVGPVVNLWGFGPGKRRTKPPTDDEVEAALARVGHTKVEARVEPPALRKSPGVYVDLSAVAKGYGVDAVARLLDNAGATAYMVEIGGEVRTRGTKPGGAPWRIGVEAPSDHAPAEGGQRVNRVVELSGGSVATSGDYRNYFEYEGRRYSHTVDPTTGRPVAHTLATVSVLAESCMEADATATALLVLGPAAGYDWAVERGVAALFVTRQADSDEEGHAHSDEFTTRATAAWDAAQPEAPAEAQSEELP